jgi:hypothetical protein
MIAITKPFSVISGKRRLAAALMLAMACYSTPSAAEFSLASVTSAERAACKPDVLRLCASEIPNVGRIIACMKRKRSSLSPACSAVVEARLASEKAAGKTATRSLRVSVE